MWNQFINNYIRRHYEFKKRTLNEIKIKKWKTLMASNNMIQEFEE